MWGWTHCSPPWVKNHAILIIIILVILSSRSSLPSLSLSSSSHRPHHVQDPHRAGLPRCWITRMTKDSDLDEWLDYVAGLIRKRDIDHKDQPIITTIATLSAHNHHNYHHINTTLPPHYRHNYHNHNLAWRSGELGRCWPEIRRMVRTVSWVCCVIVIVNQRSLVAGTCSETH